jgi:hypothetical protein
MVPQEISPLGDRPRPLGREEVAEGTMAFYFEKPSGFDFEPDSLPI